MSNSTTTLTAEETATQAITEGFVPITTQEELDRIGITPACAGNTEGMTIGNEVFLPENSSVSSALEEHKHFLQNLGGQNLQYDIRVRQALDEIEACEYLILNPHLQI